MRTNFRKSVGKLSLNAVLIGLLVSGVSFPGRTAPTVQSVAQELMCQCGCSMVLASCNCGLADEMRGAIAEKLNSGMSAPKILAFFVEKYGKKVLSAPTKKGFDLTAWVTPFVAVLLALLLIALIIKSWVGRTRASQSSPVAELESQENLHYLAKFEKDLEEDTGL